ncbi:MAG: hypothetical protein HY047_19465 [Acidobacteria bacterium]|nr:hypothetical protein [Acidobacteriota bacterium]
MRSAVPLIVLLSMGALPVSAQSGVGQPVTFGDVAVSGSVRIRAYAWRWFGDNPDGEYTYPGTLVRAGLSRSKPTYDWQDDRGHLRVRQPCALWVR